MENKKEEFKKQLIEYYNRDDIQEKIFETTIDREAIPKYWDSYGKRPNILYYKTDIGSLAKKGMTSLHVSVERWEDPLLLKAQNIELEEIRKGWDFIIDIDFSYLPYSVIAAQTIINFLMDKFKIKNISIKYSGNMGFHIGINSESFPLNYKGKEMKYYFPELPQILASYIFENTKKEIAKEILIKENVLYEEHTIIKKILIKAGIKNSEEALNKKVINEKGKNINLDKLIEILFNKYEGEELLEKLSILLSIDLLVPKIDSIAITKRHLIRSVYSFNEKSGLVSIPLKIEELMNLDPNKSTTYFRKNASLENVKGNLGFLQEKEKEVKLLLLIEDALIWNEKKIIEEMKKIKEKLNKEKSIRIEGIKNKNKKLKFSEFPPCIKNILNGLKDGKKRALFLLVNFLYYVGYSFEEIEEIIWDWNKKNPEKLKENYIKAQLKWFKKIFNQNKFYTLPNCSYKEYYEELQICEPDDICKNKKIKNPLAYVNIISNKFDNKGNKDAKKGEKENNKNK